MSIIKNEIDVLAISETWFNDDSINVISLNHPPNYILIHQIKQTCSDCEGLALYFHNTITFNIHQNGSNNTNI